MFLMYTQKVVDQRYKQTKPSFTNEIRMYYCYKNKGEKMDVIIKMHKNVM